MRIKSHAFYYSAECEHCGATMEVSYKDLRDCFKGTIPDKVFITGSLLCACEIAQPDTSIGQILPFPH